VASSGCHQLLSAPRCSNQPTRGRSVLARSPFLINTSVGLVTGGSEHILILTRDSRHFNFVMCSSGRVLSLTAISIAAAQPVPGDARRIRLPTASYRTQSGSVDTSDTIDIPEVLDSRETLEFIGFRKEVASKIFKRFDKGRAENPVATFLGYLTGVVEYSPINASGPSGDWYAALWSAGLQPKLIVRIMDPQYDLIRYTRSARYWAMDTVVMQYRFLCDLDTAILAHRRKTPSSQAGGSSAALGPSALNTTTSHLSATSVPPSLPPTNSLATGKKRYPTTGGCPLPAPPVDTAVSEPAIINNAVSLYTGVTLATLCAPRAKNGWNCTRILSMPPCDFSRHSNELYFTKEREVARQYCQFVLGRAKYLNVGIVEILVDREWLAETTHYVHGDDWKEYVWTCRKCDSFPNHLTYLDGMHVLAGPLCARDCVGDSWQSVAALRLPSGEIPMQYCFRKPAFSKINTFPILTYRVT
jgi:hypothetical protein